jgi:hypothetical protein
MTERNSGDSVVADIDAPPERVYDLISDITRVTESYEVERPLPKAVNWLTEKWTGSSDRDADLRRGMETTLARLKAAAEDPAAPTSHG